MFFEDGEYHSYDNAERNARKAFDLYEDGKLSQALVEIEAALQINPANSSWHFDKALTLDAINKFDEAIAEYEAALELNPNDLETLNCLAVDCTRTGQYDKAVSTFEYIQQLDPQFEPAYCNRIITYTEMGRHEMAEEMFYLAQQIDSECALCYYNIGNSLFMRGMYSKAVGCWRKTAEFEPLHPQINYRIAQACWADGDTKGAHEHFLAELRLDPGNIDVIFDFGLFLLETGDVESAQEKFHRILELQPAFAAAIFYLGELAFAKGDYKKAAELFEKVMETDPALPGPAYRLAQCALKKSDTQKAKSYLVCEMELAPSDASVWISMASMFMTIASTASNNHYERFGVQLCSAPKRFGSSEIEYAACCLESALQADFASADAYYYLGLLASIKGRFSDAAQSFMHCLDIRPNDVPVLKSCAEAFFAMGRLEQAIEKVARAEALAGADDRLKSIKRKIYFAHLKKRIVGFLRKLHL